MGMSTPFPVTVSGLVGPVPAAGGYVIVVGVSVRETSGAAASIELREGSATGKVLGGINLASSGSNAFAELPSIRCNGQLYCLIVGAISGAVYFR